MGGRNCPLAGVWYIHLVTSLMIVGYLHFIGLAIKKNKTDSPLREATVLWKR
jgi:hypothetical protein